MIVKEKCIRGQFLDRKKYCGGTRFLECEIYRNFIERNIAINVKHSGNNFEITLPASELMEFLKGAEQ